MSFAPFDQDTDSYFDFDQSFHNPTSPVSAFAGTVDPSKMMVGSDSQAEQRSFAGPSFEYERFKQLTGIPNGAVSSFAAMTEMTSPNTFNSAMAGPSSSAFNFTPDFNNYDMDFDISRQDTTMPAYFYPTTSLDTGDFIDPLAVGEQEVSIPPTTSRMWPGMHSRQAEQAKAETVARHQRQQQMGRQIMQQRQQQSMQTQIPQLAVSGPNSLPGSATSTDPIVEDRISRLLDQMRHNSAASSNDEDGNEGSSDAARSRLKKDEEDMDDDERLLVSEEGKKLTSKERRQLRNKVSARAFRSRRKEYITQLEAELAVKTTECNEAKARNRNLMDQNAQLTHLTQTLLRHPAFATFLNDMSNDPSILDLPVRTNNTQSTSSSSDTYHQSVKQEPVPESTSNAQVNMTLMPQTGLDLSMLSLGPTHWNTGFSFQQPQVFSLHDVQVTPMLDDHFNLSGLSGKDVDEGRTTDSKLTAPKLELPSFAATESAIESKAEVTIFDSTGIDRDDPAFALYLHNAAAVSSSCTPASVTCEPLAPLPSSTTNLSNKPNTIILTIRPSPCSSSSFASEAAAEGEINALFEPLLPILRTIESLIGI